MKALLLAGPTGVGKTDLSLKLAAEKFPCIFEIVSADSVQVYRYLDIGSGKLPVSQRRGISHYCIDAVDPDFHFDAAAFRDLAETAVEKIQSSGRIPLFTGGTGLYLEAFFRGLSPVPDVNPAVREMLMKEIEERGSAALHKELTGIDPASAERIHPNDRQRIIRALQVFRGTGLPLSYYKNTRTGRLSSRTLGLGLSMDKHALDGRIEKRVDGMMRAGFLDEVESLREKGYTTRYNSMRSIGYFELSEHLDGRYGLDEAVERIKRETKEYARKQFAWFRRDPLLKWFDFDEVEDIIEAVSVWLENGDGWR